MRSRLSVLSFALACVIGVGFAHLHTLAGERYTPAFTREEAEAMVGRRVRNIYWSDSFSGMKCPENGGLCADVRVGERGTVIGVEDESSPGECFFIVRWDEPSRGEPMSSYFGRMSRRVFLEVE